MPSASRSSTPSTSSTRCAREAGKTRVRFDITMEPSAPLPEFLIKRAKRTVLQAATEGLRRRVMRAARPGA